MKAKLKVKAEYINEEHWDALVGMIEDDVAYPSIEDILEISENDGIPAEELLKQVELVTVRDWSEIDYDVYAFDADERYIRLGWHATLDEAIQAGRERFNEFHIKNNNDPDGYAHYFVKIETDKSITINKTVSKPYSRMDLE